ncbi:uncharacterized protein BDZ99DRAFT_520890 [Mytilinidion resinicola]|uniref:Survival motor neuron Tudor domain-containing protein n=1 Tax=Mytilinidion resinicola TaxID=574789 RepID=A0A6A6YL80_9PEZI|nr:uncharacterized protein BDZ99DRAFT_520890 [Mytilinidion resinicola]KAF2809541.1 hypothetical protein BDZ99DRAFT_520890 [Mytilinidion resinicola]
MAPIVVDVDFNDRRAWDDSALVSSWEGALAEYKRYHSVHLEGKRVEDVLSPEELIELRRELGHEDEEIEVDKKPKKKKAKKPKASGNDHPMADESAVPEEMNGTEMEDQVGFDIPAAQSQALANSKEPTTSGQQQPQESADSAAPLQNTAASAALPQVLLATVQDENMKNIMMAWYYAGYYTGLHEGQQKTVEQKKS